MSIQNFLDSIESMLLAPYVVLLRQPRLRRIYLAGLLGRLPLGMMTLGVVLFVGRQSHAFSAAGAGAGAYALSSAATMPLQGRVIDRIGRRPVLLGFVIVEAGAISALVIAGLTGAPPAALVGLAAVAGASRPALAPSLRSLLRAVVDDQEQLSKLFALEGTLVEVLYTLGPVLTAGLVAVASPAAALIAAGGLSFVGTIVFSADPAVAKVPPKPIATERRRWHGALGSSAVRTTTATALTMGLTFGSLEVGVPAFAVHLGNGALAGVALGANALASFCAGLWYGGRSWKLSVSQRFALFSVLFAVGFVPLWFVSSLLAVTAVMVLSGVALAPVSISAYLLIDELATDSYRTEAYSWASTATAAGAAVGGVVAGIVAQSVGPRTALVDAAIAACITAVVGLGRYRSLVILEAPEAIEA